MDIDPSSNGLIGRVLADRYRVTRFVGHGGMGAVYEASPLRLERKRLAIKVLKTVIAGEDTVYARFRREAETVSALGHPNIVQVFDFDVTPEGAPFIVMEYLEGGTLQQLLSTVGRLAPKTAMPILEQVASALDAAHAQGIVHRDVKPENIFLLDGGSPAAPYVKLLDFGLCKLARHTGTALTVENMVFGTPYYMAPEQAAGQTGEVDARTDLFALGIVAYECLTGENPFYAPDVLSVLQNVAQLQPRPAHELEPSLPRAVSAVLDRALAKDKAARYASAGGLVAALRAAARALPEPQPLVTLAPPRDPKTAQTTEVLPRPAHHRHRAALAAAGVVVLAVAAAIVVTLSRVGDLPTRATARTGAAPRLASAPSIDRGVRDRPARPDVGRVDASRPDLGAPAVAPAVQKPRPRPVRPLPRKKARYETL